MAEDENRINTGGGTYAEGDVDTNGGDFTGRDKTVGGDEIKMSGNFEGAIVNVKATLTGVTQQINALPQAGEVEKAKLQRLVAQLEELLAQMPADKQEETEAVAELTQSLVNEAAQEKPNQTMVRINGEGLKEAARNLAGITPTVLEIATKIVAVVTAMTA